MALLISSHTIANRQMIAFFDLLKNILTHRQILAKCSVENSPPRKGQGGKKYKRLVNFQEVLRLGRSSDKSKIRKRPQYSVTLYYDS